MRIPQAYDGHFRGFDLPSGGVAWRKVRRRQVERLDSDLGAAYLGLISALRTINTPTPRRKYP